MTTPTVPGGGKAGAARGGIWIFHEKKKWNKMPEPPIEGVASLRFLHMGI
jgi:hypothetical protein